MLLGACAAEVVQAGQTRHGLVMHPKSDGARAQISPNVFGGLGLRDIGLRFLQARSGCVLRGRLLDDKRLEHVFKMALPDCSFSESHPVAVREGLALPAADSHPVDKCAIGASVGNINQRGGCVYGVVCSCACVCASAAPCP